MGSLVAMSRGRQGSRERLGLGIRRARAEMLLAVPGGWDSLHLPRPEGRVHGVCACSRKFPNAQAAEPYRCALGRRNERRRVPGVRNPTL